MRDITFKAVFKLTNTVHDVTEIMWSDRTVYLVNSKGRGRLESLDDVDLLQFTGLRDKNGKDVFEADIVKNPEGQWVVEWDEDVLSWNLNKNMNIEVTGNIYENPELLK